MATVDVSFSALPAHVRTARLVALAVARRAGVSEDSLDELRLAVGEACSRAVAVQSRRTLDTPVRMRLIDDPDRFSVEVSDDGELADDPTDAGALEPARLRETLDAPLSEDGDPEVLPSGFGLAVISGLVEDLEVSADSGRTTVRMSWPAANPFAPDTG